MEIPRWARREEWLSPSYEVKLINSSLFSTDNDLTSRLSILNCISNHNNLIPKHLNNALTDFA